MSKVKELEKLLENEVLVEVNESIKELETELSKKKKNKDLEEELKYMEQVKQYFDEVLLDISHDNLKEKDAIDILEALEEMELENQSGF
ncbi:MAG: hypothetical protein ACNI25_07955 [Halarcobacter sp.]